MSASEIVSERSNLDLTHKGSCYRNTGIWRACVTYLWNALRIKVFI